MPTLDEKITFAVALYRVAGVKIGFYRSCSATLNFFDETKTISPRFIPIVSAETNDFFSKEVGLQDIPHNSLTQLHRLLSHSGCSTYRNMEPALVHHFETSHTLALLEVLPLLVESYVSIQYFQTGINVADGIESPDSSELEQELLKICVEAECGAPSTLSVDSSDTDGSSEYFMDPRVDITGTIGKLNMEAESQGGASAVVRWLRYVPVDNKSLLPDPISEGRAILWHDSKQSSIAARLNTTPLNVLETGFLLQYLENLATENEKEAVYRKCPVNGVGAKMPVMSSLTWGDEYPAAPFADVYN